MAELKDYNFFLKNGGQIVTDEIKDAAITAAKLDSGAVGTSAIAANAVGFTQLATNTLQYAEVTLTNANMLNLRATPIEVIAAPGAGKVIEVVSGMMMFDYVGAYTESSDNLALKYVDGSGVQCSGTIEMTGFADATSDAFTGILPTSVVATKAQAENKAVVIHNTGDGELGGGNAGNAVRVKIAYRVHTTGF